MAFSLFSLNNQMSYGIKNYIADTEDDLAKVPKTTPGSMVFIIENNKYYILNHS